MTQTVNAKASRNGNGTAPHRIAMLYYTGSYTGAPLALRTINYGGPVFPLIPGHGPDVELDDGDGLNILTVEGHPYRFEKGLGTRRNGRGWEFGALYRSLTGWQVRLTDHNGQVHIGNSKPFPYAPRPFPFETCEEAETYALHFERDGFETEIVWQDGEVMSSV